MNKRKKMNRERERRAIETGWLLILLLGIRSPSLCCQLASGPSPSPPCSHPASPAGSGAAFSNTAAPSRGESCFPLRLKIFGGAFSPPPLPNSALAPSALELAGAYLKFPSKMSFHLLGEGFLSASAFVQLFLQRCW